MNLSDHIIHLIGTSSVSVLAQFSSNDNSNSKTQKKSIHFNQNQIFSYFKNIQHLHNQKIQTFNQPRDLITKWTNFYLQTISKDPKHKTKHQNPQLNLSSNHLSPPTESHQHFQHKSNANTETNQRDTDANIILIATKIKTLKKQLESNARPIPTQPMPKTGQIEPSSTRRHASKRKVAKEVEEYLLSMGIPAAIIGDGDGCGGGDGGAGRRRTSWGLGEPVRVWIYYFFGFLDNCWRTKMEKYKLKRHDYFHKLYMRRATCI